MTDPERHEHLRGLEAHLRTRIRGQDHLIPKVSGALLQAEMGLSASDQPLTSFLFIGPTGTGKTELALCFTDYLRGPGHVVRFDLSEYQNQSSVEKFIGGDRQDAGLLGRALRGRTGGTLLFDEVEKAHRLVLDLFLQMMHPARITLATGENVSLASWHIVFTSNIGAAEAMRMERSSFASVEAAVLRRVGQELRPEFVERFAEKLVFSRLPHEIQREICSLLVAHETARLRGLGHDLTVSHEALEFLLREGFDAQRGARPLRRAVESHLRQAVVGSLLTNGFASGRIAPRGGQLAIEPACRSSHIPG